MIVHVHVNVHVYVIVHASTCTCTSCSACVHVHVVTTLVIKHAGLEEEGLYRKPGVLPKANKLVKDCVEQGKLDWFNLHDEFEWDTKTLASAVKSYFSKQLGEPLLTYDLHVQFMEAASKCMWMSIKALIHEVTLLLK